MSTDDQGTVVNDVVESDDEEYYENPADVIREFGNNPLMDRAQKALTKQLQDAQVRLQAVLYEKKEELKRETLDREGLGVQLYSLQQQLARVQVILEKAHDEYNTIVDARLQEEEMLRDISKNNKEQQSLHEEYVKQHKKYDHELQALNETIRQIETYNEEVKSEIAVARRATYKVEQSMLNLEKKQFDQDLYADNIASQIGHLRHEIQSALKQIETQGKETVDARAVLKDTIRELELISNEKKQLMLQWKAALIGLSRRDEALAQATQTLSAAERSVTDYDVEVDAARREQQKLQTTHEALVNLRDRLENELQWVEDNLLKARNEREQLQERYSLLSKSLAQTDTESKRLDMIAKQLAGDSDGTIANLQLVTQERQKLEEELLTLSSTHSNVNKAVDNLNKEQMKVLKKIHERENEAIDVANDIARTKVERLNLGSINDQLSDQLNLIIKDVREKEALTSKYQLEIRQRNDEVEKKMYRVDRLNKKYEKMVESAGGEENLGPLENTIKNLVKETELILIECGEMERSWLRFQTELVGIASECDKSSEESNELQARVTILTQQQLRLGKDLRELKSNVIVAIKTNVDYQKDISKLNSLISSNHDQETELQAQNFILEMDCMDELKDAERDCIALQAAINETKTAKSTLIDEIMEMERQGLLWEKKIQLDKETRIALDPSIGQQETENMEKEIHRMSLRFEALKREQERLSIEMENAINKRTNIANRYGKPAPTKISAQAQKEMTLANAKKKISTLKKEARLLAEENSHYNSLYDDKKSKLERLVIDLEETTAQYSQAEDICHQMQSHINDQLYQKQLQQERISYRQKFINRLREVSQTGVDITQSLQVERRMLTANQALDNVKEILIDLQTSFPHLKEVLQRVEAMTNPKLDTILAYDMD